MIESPFRFEERLTSEEFERFGRLILRWSHIEHVAGNCLRIMLGLGLEDAPSKMRMFFAEHLRDIDKKFESGRFPSDARIAFDELYAVAPCIIYVRNAVTHGVLMSDDPKKELIFEHRRRKINVSMSQIFSIEELTNYAACAVDSLRYALGNKGLEGERHELPPRPVIPDFVRHLYGTLKTEKG